MQVARTQVSVESLKAVSDPQSQLTLQETVDKALEGVELDRPAILLIHTTDQKAPASAVSLSQELMNLFSGGFNDATKTALHFQFKQFSWDTGATPPKAMGLEDVPSFVVVGPDKKVLGVTQKKFWSTLLVSMDKIGISLQQRLNRQSQITQELIQTNNQIKFYEKKIKALETELAAGDEGAQRGIDRSNRRLERVRENMKDLEREEQELWAAVPQKTPQS